MEQREPRKSLDPLRDWLDDRMARGDISYRANVNGVDVYRILRHPYPEGDTPPSVVS